LDYSVTCDGARRRGRR